MLKKKKKTFIFLKRQKRQRILTMQKKVGGTCTHFAVVIIGDPIGQIFDH